ncbi:MAG: hypothetical protein HQL42_14875 [Alphaproteobacteria bacterium]|nr:hypothetical protein [Alphaproteobacteria bacterium]
MDKPIIIGIDVSKEWLDAALAGEGRVERLDNTAKAIGAWLLRARPTLVWMVPRKLNLMGWTAPAHWRRNAPKWSLKSPLEDGGRP